MTADQEKAIELLAYTTLNYQEISDEIGINRLTLYNWRQQPKFQKALAKELDIKTQIVRDNFKARLDTVYDKVYNIAMNSESEKNSLYASKFLIEQTLGRAASTVEVNANQNIKTQEVSEVDILDIFEEEIGV